MLSSLIASAIVTVQAPVPEPIIMWAVVTTYPYFGFEGGYHDVLYAILPELQEIGIDLRIQMYDAGTVWDLVWEDMWNVSGDADNNPGTYTYGVDGWDFWTFENWLFTTGYLWVDCYVYSWMTPDYLGGANLWHWTNEESDSLYHQAMTTSDPYLHKTLMWDWQEVFIHDPPVVNIYYPELMSATAAYLEGYDPLAAYYDLSELRINQTVFDEIAPSERTNDTVIYGIVEPLYGWSPLYTFTVTEELVRVLSLDTMYRMSREDLSGKSGEPFAKPTVAADYPTWYDSEDLGYEPGLFVARVPVREGIIWSDGVPCNATDVAFSYNLLRDTRAGVHAYSEFYFLQETVALNATCVDFICTEPRYDFTTIFSDCWGVGIVPWHQLKDVDPGALSGHPTRSDPKPVSMGGEGLECTGPYVPIAWEPDLFVEYWRIDKYIREKRGVPYEWADHWWADQGWGAELPEKLILKWVPNAADRLLALQSLEIDFCDYPVAPVETWETMADLGTHDVYSYLHPAGNYLTMNLDNVIISNRYVRQAIAHAIPYPTIFNEILPSWGVKTAYPGKTWILPQHETFNTELEPFEYNITVAQMYMNMWRYAQEDTDYTLGPAGDADFSGVVRLDDFILWATNFGTEPADWSFLPGNDIDPDFDNSGTVNLDDFIEWAGNYGTYYPFEGAR